MKIPRYSFFFLSTLALFSVVALFLAFASFQNKITYQKCEELGLPILEINIEGGKKVKEKNNYLKASFNIAGISGKCKIRGHGNSTWKALKKPYLLKLNAPESLLGMKSAEKWILMANYFDKTSLRNAYSSYIAKNIFSNQRWSPDNRFITLFINGRYEGLYQIYEKIEQHENRLDLKPDSFLMVVNTRMNKEFNFVTKGFVHISNQDNGITEAKFTDYKNYVQKAEDVLYSDNFKDSAEGWQHYMDIDSFIDWFLINEYGKNHDALFTASCYFFYDSEKGKLCMGPVWDFDIAFGADHHDGCNLPEGWYVNQFFWYKRLFEDKVFVNALKSRWEEKADDLRASIEWIKQEAEMLQEARMLDDAIWKTIGNRIWPHTPGWRQRKTYVSEVKYMTDWCQQRFDWLDAAIKQL